MHSVFGHYCVCVWGGGARLDGLGTLKTPCLARWTEGKLGGGVDKSYLGNATIDRAFHTYSLKISKFPGQCNQTKRKFCS